MSSPQRLDDDAAVFGPGRPLGPTEECLNCGETKDAVRASQRRQEPILCALVDYFGEASDEWERHRFVWTKADQKRAELIDAIHRNEASW